ncbi:hypothetical protein BGE01nite_27420 [Brevifollis gellanilyticus]|uniref:Uncharacterized protein n=1 Tax=Brevifollis gellanilyticus TaxID=748831 RepID=A0A512MAT5_9BACT|nr:hypothetical protein BGE01nite_27420 [Brevifollis gellanilyticus]
MSDWTTEHWLSTWENIWFGSGSGHTISMTGGLVENLRKGAGKAPAFSTKRKWHLRDISG